LPGDQVLKAIHEVSEKLNIFDGEIDLSNNMAFLDFKSVEEIKEELAGSKLELKSQEALFEVAKDLEKSQHDLQLINAEMEGIKLKIQQIKSKPTLIKLIEKLKAELHTLNEEKQKIEL
jgi:hypothetical protein